MHELLDIAPCGVLLFDDGGKILKVNVTLAGWLGYEKQGLDGKSMDTILSLASKVFYNTHFFPLVKLHSRAQEIFLTLVSKDNKSIPVLCNAVRRVTPSGAENIVVFMPVFERKKFEQEILEARRAAEKALAENRDLQKMTESLETHSRALERQNQKMQAINEDLVQFNKIISHDLQEPIRKIRLFTDMMLRSTEESLSARTKKVIEKIEKSAERLGELTGGLQQYVKVDEEVQHTMVDLNDCLSKAAARAKAMRNFNDFQLSVQPMPSVEGYPAQLELLFYHLLDNAIQFRHKKRPLAIKVESIILEENVYRSIPDRYKFVDHLRITFSDNGIGFDNEFTEKVFELGKRIHLEGKAIGVGLSLIKKIVGNHGGTITIKSESGTGTDIIIFLPTRYSESDIKA